MIPGSLRLLTGSGRWLPPFLLVLVWVMLTLTAPGSSAANHVGMFTGLLLCATWLTVTIGNLDDDPHRDLMAAALGSTRRLHQQRAAHSGLTAGAVAVLAALGATAVGTEGDKNLFTGLLIGLSLGASAVLIGVGIGTWLHRPIIYHRGAATLLGVGAVMGVILLPPIQGSLRSVHEGKPWMAAPILAAALAWAGASIVGASSTAQRLSR